MVCISIENASTSSMVANFIVQNKSFILFHILDKSQCQNILYFFDLNSKMQIK